MRDVDRERRVVGRCDEHLVGVLVLHVKDARQRLGRAAQLRMLERIADQLPAEPDLAAAPAQAIEELATRARAGHLDKVFVPSTACQEGESAP